MSIQRLLLVRVGAEGFALPLADVLEIVDTPEVRAVPLVPAGVLGQAEHRGRLLPVLDLGPLVGVARGGEAGVLLVLAVEGERMGLLVDDVVDVAAPAASAVRPVPGGSAGGILRGVLSLGGAVTGLVDIDILRAAMHARLATEAG